VSGSRYRVWYGGHPVVVFEALAWFCENDGMRVERIT
jgi:hypothetical protein